MNTSNVFQRAMLASLRISAWSARKYDKKVTDEVNRSQGAAADAGRYNKCLMPQDANSYKELTAHIAATRQLVYAQTLAWSDDGWRLLPVANYQEFTDKVRDAKHKYDALLAAFLSDYPQLRADAKIRLNGMYSEDDYPRNIARHYSWDIAFAPVPTSGDFRVTLSQEEIDVITSGTEARVKGAIEDAHRDAVKRLYDAVAHIHERLSTVETCSKCDGKGETVETRKRDNKGETVPCWICGGTGKTEAGFKDTLIGNARELCDILSRLNVTDDPRLDAFRRQTEALATVEPDTLRNDAVTRIKAANEAQGILDAMTAAFGKVA